MSGAPVAKKLTMRQALPDPAGIRREYAQVAATTTA
jgi:hypothetical protein